MKIFNLTTVPAIESVQILLTAVILTLTGLLVFIGVQVILILREAHHAAKKLNKTNIANLKLVSEKEMLAEGKSEQAQETSGHKFPHIASLQEKGRQMFSPRVFHRQGKPLA